MSDVMTTEGSGIKIKRELVKSVYSGQINKCCCGCAGSHKETSRSINTICSKIERIIDEGGWWCLTGNIITADSDKRTYVAYLD